ncbi:hypothetical protein [Streptomyces cinnamoneus]|uniref:Uncharacterized protein n=1 Tax=Streptomyces cinnamoneus TaxID=53446 RepID=A0A918U0J1_STRCJ|nr:hypothetical protein [Streptomyces cinnamoneus]GHC74446.1 hypothetical protein GCM10010507_62290 [Streptomyces cinnamoneus]
MKALGFYRELWPSSSDWDGNIGDFVSNSPQPNEQEVAAYLRNGHALFASMGVVDDVLGSGESIVGGSSLFTDGDWVWRGDLWFYVVTYHLLLPDEFTSKIRASGYSMPSVEQDRLVELTDAVQSLRTRGRN